MSIKTNVRGSSLGSEGIENYLETQSIGVGLGPVPVDTASTKRGEEVDEEDPNSRMSMQ
jgi:hypothetical protein